MSKRRKIGEVVWLAPNSGFVGESNRLKVTIQPEEGGGYPCLRDCGDDDCREWLTVWTEPDPKSDGKQHMLCHVSECEMFDEPQTK